MHAAISKADNVRLKTKNSILEVQNKEQYRYEAFLESPEITFIEFDWIKGDFTYYPSISECLWGAYDDRTLWHILLSDMVADAAIVQDIQQLAHYIAEKKNESCATRIAEL